MKTSLTLHALLISRRYWDLSAGVDLGDCKYLDFTVSITARLHAVGVAWRTWQQVF